MKEKPQNWKPDVRTDRGREEIRGLVKAMLASGVAKSVPQPNLPNERSKCRKYGYKWG